MHSADITVLRAHFKGRMVLSGDAAGCWVLHQMLPPSRYKALSAATAATSSASKLAMPRTLSPAQ